MIEKAPKGESQSNGAVEEAGKSVREMAKVLKDALEVKLKSKILPDAVVLQWLIRWSAMLLSRYKVGKDGKRGTNAEEGESVQYRLYASERQFGIGLYTRTKAEINLQSNGIKESGWVILETAMR